MRRVLFLVPLLAAGCFMGSRYDGNYRYVLTFKNATCGDTYPEGYGLKTAGMLGVGETAEDTLVIRMGDALLTGTRDGTTFTTEDSYTRTDTSCGTYTYEETLSFSGEFTSDLGITGTAKSYRRYAIAGCETMEDTEEICEVNVGIEGVRVDAGGDRHLGGANWGYVPSSGGY